MKKSGVRFFLLLGACLVVAGCAKTTRSISHSNYPHPQSYCGPGPVPGQSDAAFEYRGELSQFDVLGISRNEMVSEAEIRRALDASKRVSLRPGSSILLIQSGAAIPDAPLVAEFSKHFTVVPFSGVPALRKTATGAWQTASADPESYSKDLRLTAARGGAEMIVCCWGMIESESERLPTKTISWVPLMNWIVPDEKQCLRIRLQLALVEVRTGNWSVLSPKAFDDAKITVAPRRAAVDQKQVERLKKLAYQAAVKELLEQS